MSLNRRIRPVQRARKQRGLTTVEYAVAGALITVTVVAAFTALGGKVTTAITAITAALPAG